MPSLIADTHVHIYSIFDLYQFLRCAKKNLNLFRRDPNDQLGIFLTERFDCDFFSKLKTAKFKDCEVSCSAGVCRVTFEDSLPLYVFSGFQINTSEKLELLALATSQRVADNQPLDQTIDAIEAQEGVAVACWAFGKWSGTRGKILKSYLNSPRRNNLILADSALRFVQSKILKNDSIPLLAGSDPLPLKSDQNRVGRFAVRFTGNFDPADPLISARKLLRQHKFEIVGQQLPMFAAFIKIFKMNFGSGKSYRETL